MTVFDRAYEATPSWEIGRPQPAVVRLADAGLAVGTVLDVGCGTGENALELARRGLAVTGIDGAALAIARAQALAADRGLAAEFLVHDALRLADLGRVFDTLLDVGLFHWLQPGDRPSYAASLRTAVRPGGTCLLVCWSDRNPFGIGPRRMAGRLDPARDARHPARHGHGQRLAGIDPRNLSGCRRRTLAERAPRGFER